MAKTVSKKSAIILGDDLAATEGFTERVLLSLVVDISLLHESVERVRVQVMALAKEHGVKPVEEPDVQE